MIRKYLIFSFMLLSSSSAFPQTSIFGGFGEPAWSRTWKYFETRFGTPAKDEVVIILPTATNAAWDDPIKTVNLMEMYKWGDYMPSNAWQYAPNSGKRVSEGYRYFLNSAFVAAVAANGTASPLLKESLRRANDEVQYTRSEYNSIQAESEAAYAAYVKATPPPRMSKIAFMKDQNYDREIKSRKERFDTSLDTFATVTNSLVDPDIKLLTDAKIRLENPKQQIMLPPVLQLLNDKDRWQPYYSSYIDKDIGAFLREYSLQSQNIVEASSKSDFFEQRWSVSVSVSFLGLFRAGGASAEQVRREKHIRDNATRIDISFQNIDQFNIVRGDWYDQNLIDRFGPKLGLDAYTAIFGANGQLEMIPKTLLVGRGMKFSIYADSQSLDYLYEHFQGGADAGFFVGWFRVGGGGDYSSTKEQVQSSKFSDHIEFIDLSGRGKVLGMLAKYYAAGLPKPSISPVSPASMAANAASRKRIEQLWNASDSKVLKGVDKSALEAAVK